MAYLVVLVLDKSDQCSSILDAWESAGAKGITIIESTGLGRVRRAALRDDLPLMPSLHDLLRGAESNHRTLFSVVDSQVQVDDLIAATQVVTGDLAQPDTGLMFVVPLLQVLGQPAAENLQKRDQDKVGGYSPD